MFVRHVDLALRGKEIFLVFQVELLDLQFGCSQIYLRAQAVDGCLEKGELGAVQCKMSADSARARTHGSLDSNFSGKVSGICTEESCEITKLTNRSGNVAAEI